jgi:biuret amidohydrolase
MQPNYSPAAPAFSRTALIVVDMQCGFTRPSFPFAQWIGRLSPHICYEYLARVRQLVIPNLQRFLTGFREAGSPIAFIVTGSQAGDGSDLPHFFRLHDQGGLSVLGKRIYPPVGDPGWQIDDALEAGPGELVLNKRSAGAFATTDLERRLRDQGVAAVVMTGVMTDVCVSTTAREAADRNFKVVVVSDACAALTEERHRVNLETLQQFGSVRTTAEVLHELHASPPDALPNK